MRERLPEWIRTTARREVHGTKALLRRHGVSTVCEEARCPNRNECFSRPTATFMILGRNCTRNCGFCSVSSAAPFPPDETEPEQIARAAAEMKLKYVVITSVTRDDLPDGGASHFAKTILAIRRLLPSVKIEVLTPDFRGDRGSLETVLAASPDVFNHNIETVERLYPAVRPGADYSRSLTLLKEAGVIAPGVRVKSGFMLGLGEHRDEVVDLLGDLRVAGCDVVTIGQYLRPSAGNMPVLEYIKPEVFEELRAAALGLGFSYAASGPLVRSSMNAEEMYRNSGAQD